LLERPVRFDPEERHVVQQYRAIVAEAIGGERPVSYAPPRARLPAGAQAWTQERYTVLALTGGWATKRWPVEHWRKLAQRIREAGSQVLALWGTDEEKAQALALKPWADAPEKKLPISALAGALAHAEAVVGMDTGLVHLAAALGAPTVSLWGPSAPWRSAPLGERHLHVVRHPPCGPCFKRRCNAFVCLPGIKPEEVYAAWLRARR
ncbi:MAG: glycosyltransferase family 9 protein, partial [Zetaproteobacteria bacterium]